MYNDSISENDKQFADEFSRFVNGKMGSAAKTGKEWANDHRFLVNEKFKVVMAFMEQLAENYKQGCYASMPVKLGEQRISYIFLKVTTKI